MAEDKGERKTSHLLVKKHHEKAKVSYSRPKYRESRWEKAVKVFTINLESRSILVQGVPSLGVTKDLMDVFSSYGNIEVCHKLDEYPTEEFTEVYLIKYKRINNARYAKRKMDNKSFFGGVLHVCYAPEFESEVETRDKLREREKIIAKKIRELYVTSLDSSTVSDGKPSSSTSSQTNEVSHQQTIPSTDSAVCSSDNHCIFPFSKFSKVSYATNNIEFDAHLYQSKVNYSDIPQISPSPLTLHPSMSPPLPPPLELSRVPSANAASPHHSPNIFNVTQKPLVQTNTIASLVSTSCRATTVTPVPAQYLFYNNISDVQQKAPKAAFPACSSIDDQQNLKDNNGQTSTFGFCPQDCGSKNVSGVGRESVQSVEASVDRTVLSIREKLKRFYTSRENQIGLQDHSEKAILTQEGMKPTNETIKVQTKRQRKRI